MMASSNTAGSSCTTTDLGRNDDDDGCVGSWVSVGDDGGEGLGIGGGGRSNIGGRGGILPPSSPGGSSFVTVDDDDDGGGGSDSAAAEQKRKVDEVLRILKNLEGRLGSLGKSSSSSNSGDKEGTEFATTTAIAQLVARIAALEEGRNDAESASRDLLERVEALELKGREEGGEGRLVPDGDRILLEATKAAEVRASAMKKLLAESLPGEIKVTWKIPKSFVEKLKLDDEKEEKQDSNVKKSGIEIRSQPFDLRGDGYFKFYLQLRAHRYPGYVSLFLYQAKDSLNNEFPVPVGGTSLTLKFAGKNGSENKEGGDFTRVLYEEDAIQGSKVGRGWKKFAKTGDIRSGNFLQADGGMIVEAVVRVQFKPRSAAVGCCNHA